MWQLINLITHLKPDNLQERFPLKQWNSGRFSSLLPGQISCGFSFKYVNNCPVLICRAFNWWLSEEWCHVLSSNGRCGSLCFCGRQYSGVFILSSASSQPATGKQAPQPWMKQEVWQLESAVGPLVFSRSMSWPRSPEMQTHTHTQSSHCCSLPQPTDPNMECSRKPMISWHSASCRKQGKTPLKKPSFPPC